MAKVKAPLFGFSASGKLANSLVYMKWKGIDDVREYVVPSNPRSADQTTQRGYMTSAVGKWHSTGFTADDVTAFNLWASTLAAVMSGFNAFVRMVLDSLRSALPVVKLYDCAVGGIGAAGATVTIESDQGNDVNLYYGTTKTTLLTQETGAYVGTTWTFTLAGLAASTDYYFYIVYEGGGAAGRTGIYHFKTTA